MIVRQDTHDLPPKMFMMQIMDNIAKTYVFLWDRKDEDNQIDLTWKDLTRFHNKNSFRTSLRKLCNHGLLNYEESDEGITIEVVGWDEVSDE